MNKHRYQVVRISVKVSDTGRGLSQEQIDKLCHRIEKIAKGKSRTKTVTAIC